MKSRPAPLRVWCLLREQEAHVRPVEQAMGDRARFTYDAEWDPERLRAGRPDVVVCVNDWPSEIAVCLDAARSAGIPSVVLQDGILEWRCQYENPLFGAGGGAPQHQPVLADRIACIGDQSGRQIEAWGNTGKVEVTGMPRLDWLLDREPPPRRSPARRLLVMTAKNPGFTPAQRELTLRSLRDLKAYLELQTDVEVLWRVSRGLVPQLGVVNRFSELGGNDLVDLVEAADAVITTPSTAMLESMLLDRPVAALDYHNVPRFVPTAWTISAAEHIPAVVADLLNPPASKLAFQQDCLHDCLSCDRPAAPRVGALLERLARRRGVESGHGRTVAAAGSRRRRFSLEELYPDQPVFAERDVQALQVRLARLQRDYADLRDRQKQQGVAQRLYRLGRSTVDRLIPSGS